VGGSAVNTYTGIKVPARCRQTKRSSGKSFPFVCPCGRKTRSQSVGTALNSRCEPQETCQIRSGIFVAASCAARPDISDTRRAVQEDVEVSRVKSSCNARKSCGVRQPANISERLTVPQLEIADNSPSRWCHAAWHSQACWVGAHRTSLARLDGRPPNCLLTYSSI
jgi:hypothetical protein